MTLFTPLLPISPFLTHLPSRTPSPVVDCSHSDFRSLNKHFRKKRSTHYSERAARYSERANTSRDEPPPTTAPTNSSPTGEVTSPLSGDLKAELDKMSHHMMDMVDVRIEGVEDTMLSMNKAIRRLKRKVMLCARMTGKHLNQSLNL